MIEEDKSKSKLSQDELDRLVLEVAEFLIERGYRSFRYNETLNFLRHAIREPLDFIGVDLPPEHGGHTRWWELRELRDCRLAQDAIKRNRRARRPKN